MFDGNKTLLYGYASFNTQAGVFWGHKIAFFPGYTLRETCQVLIFCDIVFKFESGIDHSECCCLFAKPSYGSSVGFIHLQSLNTGIPQGFVLSPLLFIMYIQLQNFSIRQLSCLFYFIMHGVVCMNGVSRNRIAHLWAQLKLSISIFFT